jgi:hypothetical protein
MRKHRDALLFAATLMVALLGAVTSGDPHGAADTAIARAAASMPAARS